MRTGRFSAHVKRLASHWIMSAFKIQKGRQRIRKTDRGIWVHVMMGAFDKLLITSNISRSSTESEDMREVGHLRRVEKE